MKATSHSASSNLLKSWSSGGRLGPNWGVEFLHTYKSGSMFYKRIPGENFENMTYSTTLSRLHKADFKMTIVAQVSDLSLGPLVLKLR